MKAINVLKALMIALVLISASCTSNKKVIVNYTVFRLECEYLKDSSGYTTDTKGLVYNEQYTTTSTVTVPEKRGSNAKKFAVEYSVWNYVLNQGNKYVPDSIRINRVVYQN